MLGGGVSTSVNALDPLVKQGLLIFVQETFNGNGRTCATCHPLERSTTIDPGFITLLPPDDPVFVSETNPDLADLEDDTLVRQFALFKTSPDPAFPDFRSTNHVLALRTSRDGPDGERMGWAGVSEGDGSLREFTEGAIKQHFPKTMARVEAVDFRLATDAELDALEAFQLFLGRQVDLSLPLNLVDADASQGQVLFLDSASAKCNNCHTNAGSGINNPNFNTGVENLSQEIALQTGVFIPTDTGAGDGTFNTPPVVEAADTTPLFHNHAAQTLRDAIAFYTSANFNNSPAAAVVGGISLTSEQIGLLAAFLTVINANENINQAVVFLREAIIEQADTEVAQILLTAAIAQLEDAQQVLAIEGLHSDVQQSLQPIIDRINSAQASDDLAQEIPLLSGIQKLMILEPLSLSGISPANLEVGSTVDVTVSGAGIKDGVNMVICRNGGVTTNLVTVPDSTMLVANVTVDPDKSGTCGVTVTNADGARDILPRGSITIDAGGVEPPGEVLTLASVSPSTLDAGSTMDVALTGSGIDVGANVLVCRSGAITTNLVTVIDSTTLIANLTVAANASGACNLAVTNPDGEREVLRSAIAISAGGVGGNPLSITGVVPGLLFAGSTVDVMASGTGIQDGVSVEVCRNGGVTTNLVTVIDSTMLVANVTVDPDKSGTCGVTVTNLDGGRDVLPRGSITIQ